MELKDICGYSSERIQTSILSEDNYISTENMLPNKGGIVASSNVPNGSAVAFLKGDILISNIRPYFQKIWQADRSGGCSADVLCIRAKESANPEYLYYLLSQPDFFDYVMSGAKGCKMPRGDKKQIMSWPVDLPDYETQVAIGKTLKSLDAKIELNRRINDNLEQQAQAAFDKLLEISATYGEGVQLSQYAEVNPTRKLHKGQIARCIDMSCLPTRGSFPSDWSFKPYEGGMKFINGDTIMARITPCLENGKTAYINFLDSGETAFGSTEYIVLHPRQGYAPEMLYFLSRNTDFVSYAVSHMNGSSGRQRVAGDDIAKYELPRFQDDDLSEFNAVAIPNMKIILNNSLQNRELVNLRDALLPKLMSGELKPDQINL